jgi:hypothetical protein
MSPNSGIDPKETSDLWALKSHSGRQPVIPHTLRICGDNLQLTPFGDLHLGEGCRKPPGASRLGAILLS